MPEELPLNDADFQLLLTQGFLETQEFKLGAKDIGFAIKVLSDFFTYLNENNYKLINSNE